jgi:hypothetical protein
MTGEIGKQSVDPRGSRTSFEAQVCRRQLYPSKDVVECLHEKGCDTANLADSSDTSPDQTASDARFAGRKVEVILNDTTRTIKARESYLIRAFWATECSFTTQRRCLVYILYNTTEL